MHDEIIGHARLTTIHQRICGQGPNADLEELFEVEPALGAYLLYAGHMVRQQLLDAGVDPSVASRTQACLISFMIVATKAARQAHEELWNDLIGEPNNE